MAAAAKFGVKLLTIVIGIPVGIASRKLIHRIWGALGDPDRARTPPERGIDVADAVTWGLLSSISLVVTRLLSRRGAEATYRILTGNQPPPGKPTDAQKKREKAQKKAAKKRQKAA